MVSVVVKELIPRIYKKKKDAYAWKNDQFILHIILILIYSGKQERFQEFEDRDPLSPNTVRH